MALDEADRRVLEEIERHLEQDHPQLSPTFHPGRGRTGGLQPLPVLGAVLVLLATFGWLAVQGGSVLPVLLALPPAAVAGLALLWQRAGPAPGAEPPQPPQPPQPPGDRQAHEVPPPWWLA